MKKTNLITLVLLLLFTLAAAIISGYRTLLFLILVLSGIKFLLVSFQFMEIRLAHNFWKASVLIISIVILTSIFIIYSN